MGLRIGEEQESYQVLRLLGTAGATEIYEVRQRDIGRVESALAFNLGGIGPGDARWNWHKRIPVFLGLGLPHLPVLHAVRGIKNSETGDRYLLLGVERLKPEELQPDAMDPVTAARAVVELTRSIQEMHGAGFAHGGLKLESWRFTELGKLVLVDVGMLCGASPETGSPAEARQLMEKDHRDVARLGQEILGEHWASVRAISEPLFAELCQASAWAAGPVPETREVREARQVSGFTAMMRAANTNVRFQGLVLSFRGGIQKIREAFGAGRG